MAMLLVGTNGRFRRLQVSHGGGAEPRKSEEEVSNAEDDRTADPCGLPRHMLLDMSCGNAR